MYKKFSFVSFQDLTLWQLRRESYTLKRIRTATDQWVLQAHKILTSRGPHFITHKVRLYVLRVHSNSSTRENWKCFLSDKSGWNANVCISNPLKQQAWNNYYNHTNDGSNKAQFKMEHTVMNIQGRTLQAWNTADRYRVDKSRESRYYG